MKQSATELKGEIDDSPVIVGHINIPLSTIEYLGKRLAKMLKT